MSPSDSESSGSGRRSSSWRSSRQSDSTPRSDEDDYDLSATAVSDGFRPARTGNASSLPYHPNLPNTTFATNLARFQQPGPDAIAKTLAAVANRPSSTAKPPRPHDSLTLRNDGSGAARPGQPSTAALPDAPTDGRRMRPENAYQRAANSSHPYELYPQGTSSNGSTATVVADGPRGPTHPYAMYPQNTVPAEEPLHQHIPLGFAGVGNNYQRQLGPDGEEAGDLIGPMGHLEELPPYTRYPEQSYARKNSMDAGQDTPAAPVQRIPGAGGLGVATRNPEFSSTDEDLTMSRSRPSTRSANSTLSQHDINTAARDMAEKPTPSKWQRRGKKKMCGIVPYWAICLLTVGLIVMGVIMGAVIGTLLSRHKNSDTGGGDEETTLVPTPTSADVQPIITMPPDLSPLPTGFFALPPLDPMSSPNHCLADTTQEKAWSCDMPFRFYSMDVDYVSDASDVENYELALTAINATGAKFIWGTQPPNVSDPMTLTLVDDSFQQSYGPAWWLTLTYNKTVIVAEEDFNHKPSKRDGHYWSPPMAEFGPTQFKKKTLGAKDGDRPWICTWPDTTLEIFIYPNKTTNLAATTTSHLEDRSLTSTTSADYAVETEDLPATPLSTYPQVVKFLELRKSDDAEAMASCRQVEIINDGHDTKPVLDDHHNPIEVVIVEKSSSPGEELEQRYRDRHLMKRGRPNSVTSRDAVELTACGCLWWST